MAPPSMGRLVELAWGERVQRRPGPPGGAGPLPDAEVWGGAAAPISGLFFFLSGVCKKKRALPRSGLLRSRSGSCQPLPALPGRAHFGALCAGKGPLVSWEGRLGARLGNGLLGCPQTQRFPLLVLHPVWRWARPGPSSSALSRFFSHPQDPQLQQRSLQQWGDKCISLWLVGVPPQKKLGPPRRGSWGPFVCLLVAVVRWGITRFEGRVL